MQKMNLPNKLTILRIILVPVFVVLLFLSQVIYDLEDASDIVLNIGVAFRWLALVGFVVAAVTDFLDGWLSRKNNIVTEFGKIMDPLADKLLVSAGFIMLTGLGLMPAIVTALVVFRDFFITSFRMFAVQNSKDVSAELSGKVKTVFQLLAVVFGLLHYALMPEMELGAFSTSSMDMTIIELLISVSLVVTIVFVVIATIWSFISYYRRFKVDIIGEGKETNKEKEADEAEGDSDEVEEEKEEESAVQEEAKPEEPAKEKPKTNNTQNSNKSKKKKKK